MQSSRLTDPPSQIAGDDSATLERLQAASDALRNSRPEYSAAEPVWRWQTWAFYVAAAVLMAGPIAGSDTYSGTVLTLLMIPFACVVAVRALVAWHMIFGEPPNKPKRSQLSDDALPRYTVLIALYREAAVARQLIASLQRLDYPPDKLQIFLLTETCDAATRAALERCHLPAHMRVVAVPEGSPRTKPRALNYGLAEATGDLVVVYDAEDEPEPDQLRLAASAFANGGERLGCLQAQLKIYNADATWLTRQFAMEYAVLFGHILPGLQYWRLPITLGGTSNHFPRRVLQAAGGWDAYNVTEDADLGIRLARLGWHVEMLPSATWEEAPRTFENWRKQRIRWQKGWLQTCLVHTRQPLRLYRDLGFRAFAGLHITFASMLLSALVHPFYLAALAALFLTPSFGVTGVGALGWAGVVIFVTGYALSIATAVVAVRRSGYRGLTLKAAWLPCYWLMISAAAYGALHEFIVRRYHWNKTEHEGRSAAATSRLPAQEIPDQLQA